MKVKAELNVKNQFRIIAGLKVIKPPYLDVPKLENPAQRKTSVRINYPINKRDSITYNLPFLDNYNLQLPDDLKIECEYGIYEERYIRKDGIVMLTRAFRLYAGNHSSKEYKKLYSFLESIQEAQRKSVIVLSTL